MVEELPPQEDFWRPPARFGTVPIEAEPLGWDRRRGFRRLYPQVMLPTQVVERVSFGHPALEPNRLFWGDCLHVMRQLPSESIDLIYIDPPFFSGRQYNVIFGDRNELRSFSDIWEGGMPGYLIWLNARLYEMKRLLKKTGSIYVHCDWHASHYIKVEMDRLFGFSAFGNELIWHYRRWTNVSDSYQRMHDVILHYRKTDTAIFNLIEVEPTESQAAVVERGWNVNKVRSKKGKVLQLLVYDKQKVEQAASSGKLDLSRYDRVVDRTHTGLSAASDTWTDIQYLHSQAIERIGYPTQKPEELLRRIIEVSSNQGDVVADFFVGGGTTAAVAQRLGRRWIACDQSRVAVAITADRLARGAEQLMLDKVTVPIPDFTVEHWGIYEAKRLAEMPPEEFREFVLRCFGAVPEPQSEPRPSGSGSSAHATVRSVTVTAGNNGDGAIHGHKAAVPVWIGDPDSKKAVTAKDVQDFANAIRRTVRYQQDNLRDGIMLAWAFRPDAVEAARRLRELEQTDLNFIRLDLIRIDEPRFREHVASLTTDKADYSTFLTFVQPPKVSVGWKRLASRTYRFDVSETVVLNAGAKLINVQWDFDYRDRRFSSTQGYSFLRGKNKEPKLQAQYEFPAPGTYTIACKVQDDMGGEGTWTGEIVVQ